MATSRTNRKKYVINDFGGGIQGYTSRLLLNANETTGMSNMDVRKPGILKKVPGFAQRGTTDSTGTTTTDIEFDTYDTDITPSSPYTTAQYWAQSFTTTAAGTLSNVELYLKKLYSSTGGSTAVGFVALYSDNGGDPGTRLTPWQVFSSETAYAWETCNVSYDVEDATSYWLVVQLAYSFTSRNLGGGGSTTYTYASYWGADSNEGYAGGELKTSTDLSSWSSDDGDANFKVHIQQSGDGNVNRVKGLGVYALEDGTETMLRVRGTLLDEWDGDAGSWAKLALTFDAASTTNCEMGNSYTDDEERIYITCEHEADIAFYNGTTVDTIADQKAKHIETFRNRIYIGNTKDAAGTYPYRVQFTGEGTDVFGENDFFDDMGEPITALKTFNDSLYVFSENRLAAFDGFALRQVLGGVGTVAARSVQITNGILLFYNKGGVFAYTGSGRPQMISRPVEDYVDAIATPTAVGAGIDEYGRYNLWIGDVTVDGVALTDVLLIYDPANNSWSEREGVKFSVWTRETSAGQTVPFAGSDDSAAVYQVNTGTDADGAEIISTWVSPSIGLETPENLKNWFELQILFSPTGESEYLNVQYRLDDASSWSAIEGTANNIDLSGSADVEYAELKLPASCQSKFIQFRIEHVSDTAGFEIYQLKCECDEYVRK